VFLSVAKDVVVCKNLVKPAAALFFSIVSLGNKVAQHSVHPTGGSRRVFRQVAWLGVDSVKTALFRPAHPQVTLTVGLFLANHK